MSIKRDTNIKKDMKRLAKLVYELSEKYGGIYVSVSKCEHSNISWTTYKVKGKFKDENYFAEDEEEN